MGPVANSTDEQQLPTEPGQLIGTGTIIAQELFQDMGSPRG